MLCFSGFELYSPWVPLMRATAKILRARASEHSIKICEQIEQRYNFASSLHFNGPFITPKEERGKRKEERGKRKEERGKRKEKRGKRKEEKSSKCHKTWFRFLSQA